MKIDFCNDWTFCKEGGQPVPVHLPHDAMLLEQRDGGCWNGVNSGYFPGGKYIYEKIFDLSEQDAGKSIVLHFEGVYQNCTIFINGQKAGSHRYGYTAFDVDISDVVHAGSNRVTVHVDNSLEPNCRWYSGSGIYRPVQLLIQERVHIEAVHIETISIAPVEIKVDVTTTAEMPVTVEIYDGGILAASGKPGVIAVPNAKLWSTEPPNLYTCVVRAGQDEQQICFGIRKLEWSAKTGLLVNGQRVLLREGQTLSKDLKRIASFGGDGLKGFNTVMTSQQMQIYVIIHSFELLATNMESLVLGHCPLCCDGGCAWSGSDAGSP